MKWVLAGLGALVGIGALAAAIGATLPRNHVASRTLRLRRTPQEAWAAIIRATSASSVPADIVEDDPPRRRVTRVKETEKNFGGTWTIVVAPAADAAASAPACTVTITENGWIANPIFRFVSKFVMGHHATMDAMLKEVAKQFHEEPALTGE